LGHKHDGSRRAHENGFGKANSGPKYWTPKLILNQESMRSDATS
jgi:hypothetical protein